ncbi:UNVERIFIED_CONTAM: hypothetical protein ABIC26_002895 [Paenibacillus sp. PvR008]
MATATITTGPVLNGSETGARAQIVRVLISNDDSVPATFEIEVFSIPDNANNSPKVPIAHQLFSIGALTAKNVDIPIFGAPIFEVQLRGTSSNPTQVDTITTVVGVDAGGKIVDNLQFLNFELIGIAALTPIA